MCSLPVSGFFCVFPSELLCFSYTDINLIRFAYLFTTSYYCFHVLYLGYLTITGPSLLVNSLMYLQPGCMSVIMLLCDFTGSRCSQLRIVQLWFYSGPSSLEVTECRRLSVVPKSLTFFCTRNVFIRQSAVNH